MVVETKKATTKKAKIGRNRGIPKTQLGFSLDQQYKYPMSNITNNKHFRKE
jgi:hypothetical protein